MHQIISESLFANGGDRDSSKFTLKKSSSDRVDGNLSVPVDCASAEVTGAASSSQEWSITLQKNCIPLTELDALQAKRYGRHGGRTCPLVMVL